MSGKDDCEQNEPGLRAEFEDSIARARQAGVDVTGQWTTGEVGADGRRYAVEIAEAADEDTSTCSGPDGVVGETRQSSFDARSVQASTAVVREVAALRGVEEVSLPPLYAAVAPDALDAIIARAADTTAGDTPASTAGVEVTFAYAGSLVTVEATGTITVSERLE